MFFKLDQFVETQLRQMDDRSVLMKRESRDQRSVDIRTLPCVALNNEAGDPLNSILRNERDFRRLPRVSFDERCQK